MDPRSGATGGTGWGNFLTGHSSWSRNFDITRPVAADPKSALNGQRKFNPAQPWRVEDSLELYHVEAWGKGYFSVNDSGHVVVRPDTTERH